MSNVVEPVNVRSAVESGSWGDSSCSSSSDFGSLDVQMARSKDGPEVAVVCASVDVML